MNRPCHYRESVISAQPPPVSAATAAAFAACQVVFLPAGAAGTARLGFVQTGEDVSLSAHDPARAYGLVEPADREVGGVELADLELALPDGDGVVGLRTVSALLLPVRAALPVLTRARVVPGADPSAVFWGAAAVLALQFTARGLLLPGLGAGGRDAWRVGPLRAADVTRVRSLAAAMPPRAQAVPLPREEGEESGAGGEGAGPLLLADPEALLRAFLDAVADTLPRSPAARLVTGGHAAFAAPKAPSDTETRAVGPEFESWAADLAAGHDAGVRISLRVEVDGLSAAPQDETAQGVCALRAVLQVHGLADALLVADAAEVWVGRVPALGPRARAETLLALRRATRAWPPLAPLLAAAVPDRLELLDEEVGELLGAGGRALASAGVEVHWPKELARGLTTQAEIGPRPGTDGESGGSGFSSDALLSFTWWFSLGGCQLGRAELDALAEAGRPVVRLQDRWVLVDPEEVRIARARADEKVTPLDALGSVLTGSTEVEGRRVTVRPTGWLAELRDRLLAEPGSAAGLPQPDSLRADLRDYQLRGFNWLHTMTSLGLGACLADDMGLGKTITLIALHLQRQTAPDTAGATLVICPTSLMGNWQREIERFAPGTPVRRFHGAARDLDEFTTAPDEAGTADGPDAGPGAGPDPGPASASASASASTSTSASPPAAGFVLTTYGTMRRDAERLGRVDWGLVVADEAQHVKNPYAATARQLRTIGARARVALTGTPVENNLSELWAILDWTTPGLLGRLGGFRTHYAKAIESGTDPAAAERLGRLVRPFLLRRLKTDPGIAPELPAKTETDRAVALTPEQTGLYEAVVRETLARIAAADGMARRGLVVQLLTSLKQICNHPAQYLKEKQPRLMGRSGKLELLDELLDTILAEGAGVLVFTQYVAMARLLEQHLAERGTAAMLLHGGTRVAAREEMVRRFQESGPGAVPVFLLSLKAAGTGLNLTRAAHVVHFDRWWNPAVEAQATDRAYRIGQTQPVQVHRLIAEGTLEDRIAQLLERKQRLADTVLGSGEGALTELTDTELAELVALRGGTR